MTTLFVLIYITSAGSLGIAAVEQHAKPQLVQELEKIFYSKEFAAVPERIFKVGDYGGVGDGRTLDRAAIQKAIDAASTAGGGRVTFAPGTYLSGAIFLKSNVELRLDKGVVLKAVQDDSKYPEIWTRTAGVEMEWPAALVNVNKQRNVRITGKGVIDGNGTYWWYKFWGKDRLGGMLKDYEKRGLRWAVDYDCKRVRAVVVWKSSDVLLKDFTVERSGFWTVTMTYCDRVHVDGLIIRNNIGGHGPSSDGINTDSSSNILVENCDVDCNDDNLCVKSGRDADGLRVNRPSENVVYRNCLTRSGHGMFTIGSETSGGMRNIEVYGLKAQGTRSGVRFKSARVRGGLIEHIHIHDIEMNQVGTAFDFELNWFPQFSYPKIPAGIPKKEISHRWKTLTLPVEPPGRGIPEFRNIHFSNISAKRCGRAFAVNAYAEMPIHDLHFKNVSIEAETAGSIAHARNWFMENVSVTPTDKKPLMLEKCSNVIDPTAVGGP